MKRSYVLVLAGIITLVLVLIVLSIGKRRSPGHEPIEPNVGHAPVESDRPSFHPDQVTGFTWKTGESTRSFERTGVSAKWNPETPPWPIQERLNFLALAYPEKLQIIENPLISVTVRLSESEWTGGWDGTRFVWSSGPMAGRGKRLSVEENEIFQEGGLAFTNHKLSWCSARPASFKYTHGGTSFEIRQNGPNWERVQGDAIAPMDATVMEKWIGSNCDVVVERLFDPSMSRAVPEFTGELQVRFKTSDAEELKRFRFGASGYLAYVSDGRSNTIFKSEQLRGAIDALAR